MFFNKRTHARAVVQEAGERHEPLLVRVTIYGIWGGECLDPKTGGSETAFPCILLHFNPCAVWHALGTEEAHWPIRAL